MLKTFSVHFILFAAVNTCIDSLYDNIVNDLAYYKDINEVEPNDNIKNNNKTNTV